MTARLFLVFGWLIYVGLPACLPASPMGRPPASPSALPHRAEASPAGDLSAYRAAAHSRSHVNESFSDEVGSMEGGTEGGVAGGRMPQAPPSSSLLRKQHAGMESGSARDAAAARAPVVVYTAQLTMATLQVPAAIKSVETLASELGGFMARESNDEIIVRVPAARFQEALQRLEKLGDVTNRRVDAEDVSEEFSDLEVRLKSKRAVRERLEQLLARATKMEDSIAIERELERVGGEIEQIEGRLKFLRDRAQFSTIAVHFTTASTDLVAKRTFKLPFSWLDQLGLGRLLDLR